MKFGYNWLKGFSEDARNSHTMIALNQGKRMKFRKIIGKNDFPYHFKKIIVRYKKIGYNIDRLHAWLLIQSRLTALLTSLIARR